MCVMVTTGGLAQPARGRGRLGVRAELPAAQRQMQRHKDQPETGAESHSLWLFTVHEATVSGDLADHVRGWISAARQWGATERF